MKTFAITFTDFAGHFWNVDWEPATSKNKPLSKADIQAVVHYIKNGSWPKNTSVAAKNCYDTLASQIANIITEDAFASIERSQEAVWVITDVYSKRDFSPKGQALLTRLEQIKNNPKTPTNERKGVIKKLIKTENLFAVKFAEDEDWRVEIDPETMKCCICGKPITTEGSHDPYPVRPESWYGEKKNRCCRLCNDCIVVPCRIIFGRTDKSHDALMKMNYMELLNRVSCLKFS